MDHGRKNSDIRNWKWSELRTWLTKQCKTSEIGPSCSVSNHYLVEKQKLISLPFQILLLKRNLEKTLFHNLKKNDKDTKKTKAEAFGLLPTHNKEQKESPRKVKESKQWKLLWGSKNKCSTCYYVVIFFLNLPDLRKLPCPPEYLINLNIFK